MANLSCDCRRDCVGIAIITSIFIGIIAAFLRFMAVITVTAPFLWVVFGIAVLYLAITLIASATTRKNGFRNCFCPILSVLLTGILGAILISIILLAIEFAATSIIGAIITGLLITFFSLIITATACLVKCTAGCSETDAD